MNGDYELLTEKEAMWAEMLEQVLKDNGVDCVAVPVYGAAMALKAGVQERHKIFVPHGQKPQAKELMDALFSDDAALPVAPEDEEESEEE